MKCIFVFVKLVFVVLVFSCCTRPVKPIVDLIQINIDPDKIENYIDLSPLLDDSIDIIPLETADECLLSNIERLTFYKERIYVMDESRQNVFVFDEAGHYVGKIGRQGNGPGEYSAIMYYSIIGDSMLIQNQRGFNAVIYSLTTGEAVKNFTHAVSHFDGFCIGNSVYFITNYEKVDRKNFNLCKYDWLEGKVTDKFISFDEKLTKFSSLGLRNYTSQYLDSVYLIYPYNDTIYRVTEQDVVPLYNIHFTDRNLPDDIQPVAGSFRRAVAEGNYVKGLENIQMSKDFIWGTYGDGIYNRYVCVNRHTLEPRVGNCFTVQRLGHLPSSILYISGNDLISVQSASSLGRSLNTILSSAQAPLEDKYRVRLQELQKNLKDDSNPVLFRYRLKEVN